MKSCEDLHGDFFTLQFKQSRVNIDEKHSLAHSPVLHMGIARDVTPHNLLKDFSPKIQAKLKFFYKRLNECVQKHFVKRTMFFSKITCR